MKSPDDAYFVMWKEHPEPSLPELDPQVVLDNNMEDTAYLYNTHNNENEWLTFIGEPMPIKQ